MKNLFVPYHIAVIAKEKGFNEPCMTHFETYFDKTKLQAVIATLYLNSPYENEYNGYDQKIINDQKNRWFFTGYKNSVKDHGNDVIAAPLYCQLVDWFREKHGLHIWVKLVGENEFMWEIKDPLFSINEIGTEDDYYSNLTRAIEKAFKLI